MTQEDLLTLMHKSPEKGLQAVTAQYAALVYKVVWGKLSAVCTSEDIEEAVSDVFLEFYKKFTCIDLSKGSLTTFLITLAQRRAVDVFRKIIRQNQIDDMLSKDVQDISFRTDDTVLENEERKILLEAVLKLGEPDATIIYRKFFYGENYCEIGNRLGLSENAVNKRYLRAIDKLSLIMKGENFCD